MDLLDFEGQELYFDEAATPEVDELLQRASSEYPAPESETYLLRAYFLMPQSLTVLVALYRYYYYQHRMQDTLAVAHRAMSESGKRISFPQDWRELTGLHLAGGVVKSIGLVRFYLLALKGAGYVNLRLDNMDEGLDMLHKVLELDDNDRLGAAHLIKAVKQHQVNVRRDSIQLVGANV